MIQLVWFYPYSTLGCTKLVSDEVKIKFYNIDAWTGWGDVHFHLQIRERDLRSYHRKQKPATYFFGGFKLSGTRYCFNTEQCDETRATELEVELSTTHIGPKKSFFYSCLFGLSTLSWADLKSHLFSKRKGWGATTLSLTIRSIMTFYITEISLRTLCMTALDTGSLVLGVIFAEWKICWVSFMLSILYAEYPLCWVSFMLSVLYAECPLC